MKSKVKRHICWQIIVVSTFALWALIAFAVPLSVAAPTAVQPASAEQPLQPGTYELDGTLDDSYDVKPDVHPVLLLTIEEDQVVEIPDAKLKELINYVIDKNRPADHDITLRDMQQLTTLDLSEVTDILPGKDLKGTPDFKFAVSRGIKDLTGLNYATNLTTLKLGENEISDLSPLSHLTKLTTLELDRNRITDVSALSSLTNLTHLKLYNNLIEDISPLKTLTNLTYLDVHFNQLATGDENNPTYTKGISDVSVVEGMPHLELLDISNNQVTSLKGLLPRDKVTDLIVSSNAISDFSGHEKDLVNRLAKMYNEGVGSVNFFGQKVKAGPAVVVTQGKGVLASPYKGIEQLSSEMKEQFGLPEDFHLFSEIKVDHEGIEAVYDKTTQTFVITLDEAQQKALERGDLNVKMTLQTEEFKFYITDLILTQDHPDSTPGNTEPSVNPGGDSTDTPPANNPAVKPSDTNTTNSAADLQQENQGSVLPAPHLGTSVSGDYYGAHGSEYQANSSFDAGILEEQVSLVGQKGDQRKHERSQIQSSSYLPKTAERDRVGILAIGGLGISTLLIGLISRAVTVNNR